MSKILLRRDHGYGTIEVMATPTTPAVCWTSSLSPAWRGQDDLRLVPAAQLRGRCSTPEGDALMARAWEAGEIVPVGAGVEWMMERVPGLGAR